MLHLHLAPTGFNLHGIAAAA